MRPSVLMLALASVVFAGTSVTPITTESNGKIPTRHQHRKSPIQLTVATGSPEEHVLEKRDSKSSSSESKSSSITSTSSSVTSMPKLSTTAKSSSSTTSYSYSLDIPSADKSGSFEKNPFILRAKEPEGLVFIIVGAILGACAICSFVVLFITWLRRRRIAESEKEVYYRPLGFGAFGIGRSLLQSAESSYNDSNSTNSASSLLMMSRQNSIMLQQQSDASLMNETSQQGRSYRGNVTGNRSSMFISPVLEFMNTQKNGSQMELPLFSRPPDNVSSASFLNATNSSSYNDYAYRDIEREKLLHYDTDSNTLHENLERPRMKRPPSQFLDDLIDIQNNEKASSPN